MKSSYPVQDLAGVPPIEFEMGGETFRVPRKPRPDVLAVLAQGIQLNANGDREYRIESIRTALIVMMAQELYLDVTDPETGTTSKQWVQVDDGDRFVRLLNSPRFSITSQDLGDLCWDLVEEISDAPTNALRPSSGS